MSDRAVLTVVDALERVKEDRDDLRLRLADHARLVAEVAEARAAADAVGADRDTIADVIRWLDASLGNARDNEERLGVESHALRAELTTERDAHQATRDALARERADLRLLTVTKRAAVEMPRDELSEMQADAVRIIAELDAARAEVARLRGLVERACVIAECVIAGCHVVDTIDMAAVRTIRTEAAGE